MSEDPRHGLYDECKSDATVKEAYFCYTDLAENPTRLLSLEPKDWEESQLRTLSGLQKANSLLNDPLIDRLPTTKDWTAENTKLTSASQYLALRASVFALGKIVRENLRQAPRSGKSTSEAIQLTKHPATNFERLQIMSPEERETTVKHYRSILEPFMGTDGIDRCDEFQDALLKPVGESIFNGQNFMDEVETYRTIKKCIEDNDLSVFGGRWSLTPHARDDTTQSGNMSADQRYLESLTSWGLTEDDIANAVGVVNEIHEKPQKYESESQRSVCHLADNLKRWVDSTFRGKKQVVDGLRKHCANGVTTFDCEGKLRVETWNLSDLTKAVLSRPFHDPAQTYLAVSSMTTEEREAQSSAFDEKISVLRDFHAGTNEQRMVEDYKRLMFGSGPP